MAVNTDRSGTPREAAAPKTSTTITAYLAPAEDRGSRAASPTFEPAGAALIRVLARELARRDRERGYGGPSIEAGDRLNLFYCIMEIGEHRRRR